MKLIDEKFKDNSPVATVEKLQKILKSLDIDVMEIWNDSGVDNCCSLRLSTCDGKVGTNGKGVTRELARASAYGEFIERLQAGLLTAALQSVIRDPEMDMQTYAPDGKYMTMEELIKESDWMDILIQSYKSMNLTRESIAEHCRAYACADDGRILTLPFYSLFEDRYVYLPSAFVTQMYTANGNCAGNTREEAWVHALSEIMERHASQKYLLSGKATAKIPQEVLEKFPTVTAILKRLRENDAFDVEVFDYSIGNGFPVVATRVIDKSNQSYIINVGADPVLEIAVQRTLTELFQGRNIVNFSAGHTGQILGKVSDFPKVSNVINQLQTGSGVYTADFFSDRMDEEKPATVFADNSDKTNKQLLDYILDVYKKMGKQVYVRNFSFMGFPSYKFVVPGFSETRWICLDGIVPDYAIADTLSEVLRNPSNAVQTDLQWFISYSDMLKTYYRRYASFEQNGGLPLSGAVSGVNQMAITRAYAAYKLQNYALSSKYLKQAIEANTSESDRGYLSCVRRYLKLKTDKIDDDTIRIILFKFFKKQYADRLYNLLDHGYTPFEEYLIHCDKSCADCSHNSVCAYTAIKGVITKAGKVYSTFVNGQDRAEFLV